MVGLLALFSHGPYVEQSSLNWVAKSAGSEPLHNYERNCHGLQGSGGEAFKARTLRVVKYP